MTGYVRGRGPRAIQDEFAEQKRKREAETTGCPTCQAPAGQVCTDRPGRPVPGAGYHPGRHRRFLQGW